jgi:hypothetical protein
MIKRNWFDGFIDLFDHLESEQQKELYAALVSMRNEITNATNPSEALAKVDLQLNKLIQLFDEFDHSAICTADTDNCARCQNWMNYYKNRRKNPR